MQTKSIIQFIETISKLLLENVEEKPNLANNVVVDSVVDLTSDSFFLKII